MTIIKQKADNINEDKISILLSDLCSTLDLYYENKNKYISSKQKDWYFVKSIDTPTLTKVKVFAEIYFFNKYWPSYISYDYLLDKNKTLYYSHTVDFLICY